MNGPRIVIVGAGPAGTRAATTLADQGLRPTVVDESPRSGGQIYRRPPTDAGFRRPAGALYGFEAGKARRLHEAFDALAERIDYRPGTLVWEIDDGAIWLDRDGTIDALPYDALILATGATDRVIPIPGWTLPGVFTLGGAQIALKYQGCAIGRRVAFVGTGPLLYLVSWQYVKAGATIAAVVDTSSARARRRALPALLAGGTALLKGMYYVAALRARGIEIADGATPMEILGDDTVAGLRFRDAAGIVRRIACDAVAIGFGLRSETQLADLAGCRFDFDAAQRQWLPAHDDAGRAAGVAGLYLAGDGAGIGGADAAELQGERAAWALLADLGRPVPPARVARLARRQRRLARFRAGLEAAFPFPADLVNAIGDDTVLCRCEAIPAGALRAAVRDLDATEVNRAKAYSRVGMGRCQGRVCGAAAAELLAALRGCTPAGVDRLRGQPPVKPLPVGALARTLPPA